MQNWKHSMLNTRRWDNLSTNERIAVWMVSLTRQWWNHQAATVPHAISYSMNQKLTSFCIWRALWGLARHRLDAEPVLHGELFFDRCTSLRWTENNRQLLRGITITSEIFTLFQWTFLLYPETQTQPCMYRIINSAVKGRHVAKSRYLLTSHLRSSTAWTLGKFHNHFVPLSQG